MAAGLRAVLEASSLIDIVVEVRDARLPRATAVATLHRRLNAKPTFVLLNRQDVAEVAATQAWLARLAREGVAAFAGTATQARTLRELRRALLAYKGRQKRLRVAVVGAPNTGKSSLINALARRKRTAIEDRAGVTRHVRWIAAGERVDVLDTPGVLEPRITDKATAWQLALCGILPETAVDREEVIEQFGRWVALCRPELAGTIDLESFARRRGMLRRGGEIDRRNAARALLKEFQAGRLGRFTFEPAEEGQ